MKQPISSVWLMVACLCLARFETVTLAQTFAAHLESLAAGSQSTEPLGRVYVSDGKTRIETRQLPDGFFLIDSDKPAVWFLRPKHRVFMDARRSSSLTQIFVRVDPAQACRQWQVMEAIAGPPPGTAAWQCDLIGREVVDGRETVKYRTISSQNHRSYRWVDVQRHFPIRVENEDGAVLSVDLIVEGPQSPTLFAVPGGYGKFDPLELLERIKRSDVWVER